MTSNRKLMAPTDLDTECVFTADNGLAKIYRGTDKQGRVGLILEVFTDSGWVIQDAQPTTSDTYKATYERMKADYR